GRRPPATCRSRGSGSGCCGTCRSAPPRRGGPDVTSHPSLRRTRGEIQPMPSIARAAIPLVLLLAACGGGAEVPEETGPSAVLVNPAMIAVVDSIRLESGPVVSGTLVAERVAQLRPQV